jgi:hypothetical protein
MGFLESIEITGKSFIVSEAVIGRPGKVRKSECR